MSNQDPLDIEELLRQAQAAKRGWRPPDPDQEKPTPGKPWQQVMDDRLVKYRGQGE